MSMRRRTGDLSSLIPVSCFRKEHNVSRTILVLFHAPSHSVVVSSRLQYRKTGDDISSEIWQQYVFFQLILTACRSKNRVSYVWLGVRNILQPVRKDAFSNSPRSSVWSREQFQELCTCCPLPLANKASMLVKINLARSKECNAAPFWGNSSKPLEKENPVQYESKSTARYLSMSLIVTREKEDPSRARLSFSHCLHSNKTSPVMSSITPARVLGSSRRQS
jgi:hypothetical protein